MRRWYLIHTKPSHEALAQANLERQGFGVYFPRALQSVQVRQGCRERIVPLFPRYLFLQVHASEQALAPVRSTVGVSGIVRFGSEYTVVPDRVVEELQARADRETGLHRLKSSIFARGTPVTVSFGSCDAIEGVFEREAGAERVVVLLNLLGQDASVCVPIGSVYARGASSFAR
jgi:transcriptional antiterminator RfaH